MKMECFTWLAVHAACLNHEKIPKKRIFAVDTLCVKANLTLITFHSLFTHFRNLVLTKSFGGQVDTPKVATELLQYCYRKGLRKTRMKTWTSVPSAIRWSIWNESP